MLIDPPLLKARALFTKKESCTSAICGIKYTKFEVNMLTEPYVGERLWYTVAESFCPFKDLKARAVLDVKTRLDTSPIDGRLYHSVNPKNGFRYLRIDPRRQGTGK